MAANPDLRSDLRSGPAQDEFYTVDIGCNYGSYNPEIVKKIVNASYEQCVSAIVSISNNIAEAAKNLKLVKAIPQLYMTLGCHPHSAKRFTDDDLIFMKQTVSDPESRKTKKIVAIGECGLDYNRMFSEKGVQIDVFTKQVTLAKQYGLKLYLHCRNSTTDSTDAFDDMIRILDNACYSKGVVHCFTGTLDQAIEFTRRGLKLGITGWITDVRRNHDLVSAISSEMITLDMLYVETDAPYMPIRPKKNSEPIDTAVIVSEIARLKKLDDVDVGHQIYANSLEFLGVDVL